MRQAIHILKKDIRHLWIEIVIVAVASALLVLADTVGGSRPPQGAAAILLSYLLPAAWCLLIVGAVHSETLTGDREFWQTRPYSWKSLLAAKVLLAVLFINVPMLVAQAIILQAQGFPLRAELPGLMWNQLLLSTAFMLPAAVIAALTSGVVQVVLIGLGAFASLTLLWMRFLIFPVAFSNGDYWRGMEWIRNYYVLLVVVIAAPVILVWQYARRRTRPARLLAVAVVCMLLPGAPIPWTTAFAIQSRLSRRPAAGYAVRAGLNARLSWMTRARIGRDHRVDLLIPLELTGIAGDVPPRIEGLTASLEGAGGAVWHVDRTSAHVSSVDQLITLETTVDESFYQRVKQRPVKVRGYVYLTLYGNMRATKVPVSRQPRHVPGVGICTAIEGTRAPYFLECSSGFRPQSDGVFVVFVGSHTSQGGIDFARSQAISYSPFPAELSIHPVTTDVKYSTLAGPLESVTVGSLEPLAHVRVPLAIDGLRLAPFEVLLK